jgi:hypothetical protein
MRCNEWNVIRENPGIIQFGIWPSLQERFSRSIHKFVEQCIGVTRVTVEFNNLAHFSIADSATFLVDMMLHIGWIISGVNSRREVGNCNGEGIFDEI